MQKDLSPKLYFIWEVNWGYRLGNVKEVYRETQCTGPRAVKWKKNTLSSNKEEAGVKVMTITMQYETVTSNCNTHNYVKTSCFFPL